MSAPETNIEKQAKKHKGPLAGMAGVLVFVGVLLAAFVIWTVYNGDTPEGAETQIDSRTGTEVEVDDGPEIETGLEGIVAPVEQ